MCGIAGWIAFGEQRPPPGTASLLLLALEERGKNASGITYAPKWGCRSAGYIKHHLPAEAFVVDKAVQKHLDVAGSSQICLVHTRSTTKGDEKTNTNNHPVFREGGKYILVHNGTLANDDEIFKELDVKRQAEVDTEAIAALLDMGVTASNARSRLQEAGGTYSLAAFPKEKPDHVIVVRRSSPLYYTVCPKRDLFTFGSTAIAALIPFQKEQQKLHRGLTVPTLPTPVFLSDNSYLIIGLNGLVEKGEHRITVRAEASEKKYVQQTWEDWLESDWRRPLTSSRRIALPSGNRMPFNVSSSLGFMKPAYLQAVNNTALFTGPFPIVGQREEVLNIKCPACWEWVNAQTLVNGWECPGCATRFAIPKVFRALRPSEEASGKIYLG